MRPSDLGSGQGFDDVRVPSIRYSRAEVHAAIAALRDTAATEIPPVVPVEIPPVVPVEIPPVVPAEISPAVPGELGKPGTPWLLLVALAVGGTLLHK